MGAPPMLGRADDAQRFSCRWHPGPWAAAHRRLARRRPVAWAWGAAGARGVLSTWAPRPCWGAPTTPSDFRAAGIRARGPPRTAGCSACCFRVCSGEALAGALKPSAPSSSPLIPPAPVSPAVGPVQRSPGQCLGRRVDRGQRLLFQGVQRRGAGRGVEAVGAQQQPTDPTRAGVGSNLGGLRMPGCCAHALGSLAGSSGNLDSASPSSASCSACTPLDPLGWAQATAAATVGSNLGGLRMPGCCAHALGSLAGSSGNLDSASPDSVQTMSTSEADASPAGSRRSVRLRLP